MVGNWNAGIPVPFGLGTAGGFGPVCCPFCAIVAGVHTRPWLVAGAMRAASSGRHRRVATCYESKQVGRGTSMWRCGLCMANIGSGDLLYGRGERGSARDGPSLRR